MHDLRILLVDDEEELVSTLVERLSFRGIAAEFALDGYDALAKLRDQKYSAVVLDLKLPGMEGTEVLRRISMEHPDVPVLLITGHGSAMEGPEPTPEGAYACLMKPVKLEDLVRHIQEAVSHQ